MEKLYSIFYEYQKRHCDLQVSFSPMDVEKIIPATPGGVLIQMRSGVCKYSVQHHAECEHKVLSGWLIYGITYNQPINLPSSSFFTSSSPSLSLSPHTYNYLWKIILYKGEQWRYNYVLYLNNILSFTENFHIHHLI